MKVNLALWDRIVRWLVSVFLLVWAFAGGASWAYLMGLLLLATSAWGWCPFYVLLGIKTYSLSKDSLSQPQKLP
jgi:hypothetical protein